MAEPGDAALSWLKRIQLTPGNGSQHVRLEN